MLAEIDVRRLDFRKKGLLVAPGEAKDGSWRDRDVQCTPTECSELRRADISARGSTPLVGLLQRLADSATTFNQRIRRRKVVGSIGPKLSHIRTGGGVVMLKHVHLGVGV